MLPARLHSGVLYLASLNKMIPPRMDLADSRQESARDRWVQQQMEEAMKHLPTDLEVLPSPLLLEQMEREAVQRRSTPATLAAHSRPAVKPSPSSRRKKRRRGAPSCGSAGEEVVSLPADVRAAASKPASSPATALSARLAAAPSILSSLAPARCSEATPVELEQRLRFYARQIKNFRTTSLMYSSPELVERIRQMERDYETAVRLFYCRQPSPTPSHMSGAAAQSTSCLQNGVTATAEQTTPGLQEAATAEQPTSGLQSAAAEQPTSGPQPDTPRPDSGPDPKSASTSSTRRRGRRKRDAQAQGIGGLGDRLRSRHQGSRRRLSSCSCL
ncbi:hypothetical protein ILYODFUR_038778 [Ilyodon furcidens]|uniref:Uncharacterized protein n=1 Tax=Ilyodon furcidens TaxID=33524 RepID=A0ABV0U5K0_9TELE